MQTIFEWILTKSDTDKSGETVERMPTNEELIDLLRKLNRLPSVGGASHGAHWHFTGADGRIQLVGAYSGQTRWSVLDQLIATAQAEITSEGW